MPDKEQLKKSTKEFLITLALELKSSLGEKLYRTQKSQWMTADSPNSSSSKNFTRKIIDRFAVMIHISDLSHADQTSFVKTFEQFLQSCGISKEQLMYGYVLPLVDRWIKADPHLDINDAANPIIDSFADAVLTKKQEIITREAIVAIDHDGRTIKLDPKITIRPITEDELFHFGDNEPIVMKPDAPTLLSPEWMMLEIVHPVEILSDSSFLQRVESDKQIYAIHEAVTYAIAISTSDQFWKVPIIETSSNYGFSPSRPSPTRRYKAFNQRGAKANFNAQFEEEILYIWPKIKSIFFSKNNSLRISAARMVDSGTRDRDDDAIIDLSIGLESLLTAGIEDELSYRLSLRGSRILSIEGEKRKESFDGLKNLYSIRSKLVHGSLGLNTVASDQQLANTRVFGDRSVRKIWKWFLKQDNNNLEETLRKVDELILS